MTVRVVGFEVTYQDGTVGLDDYRIHGCVSDPLVSLPAVIEALTKVVYGGHPYDLERNVERFLLELQSLTTPAAAGGRVK